MPIVDPFHTIYTPEKLAAKRAQWKSEYMKVVFTNGVFDLIHPGHVQYLSEAKALGDVLIVAVNSDASARGLGKGAGRPINHEGHRASVLAALKGVDAVVLFNEPTPEEIIRLLIPDVLVKGGDYRPETVVGSDIVKSHGGEVRVLSFLEGYSTTAIEQKIKSGV